MKSKIGKMVKYIVCLSLCTASSCPDEHETKLWDVNNHFGEYIIGINAERTNDGDFVPSRYKGKYCTHLEYFPPNTGMAMYSYHNDRNNEMKSHYGLRMYFSICLNDPVDNWRQNSHEQVLKYALAYIDITTDWMLLHNWIINFPEDCTVNPDLWKIYDLDKFVELYGPLNAQGWDEVWQKWEQAKASESDNP